VGITILLAATIGCKPNESKPAAQTAQAPVVEVAQPKAAVEPSQSAVKVEFYVMSQCPYGVQVVDGVIPVLAQLGSEVDFNLEFIGQQKPDGTLTAMHGPNEVTGNKAQLCAAELAPATYLDFVGCQNKDSRNVATNWRACAGQANIPMDALQNCIEAGQGDTLLAASYKRAQAKGARGSPTMFIGNKPYQGRRTPDAFMRAICEAHANAASVPACAALPELKPVNLTIISDKRCEDCNIIRPMRQLANTLSKPVFKELDISDAAAQELYAKVGGKALPLVLVDETIKDDPSAMKQLERSLMPTADAAYRSFNVGAKWNPACADKGGCDLPECKDTITCQPESPGKLEVFVMSQCPYGVRALDAMPEVLKNFGNQIDFQIHFIATGTAAGGFKALHGQSEVDENIRELCAIKHYGADYKYMDYILCRNKNIRSDNWVACTGSNGIDTSVMKTCFEGAEGKLLHEEDIKLGKKLNISASPTWLANGKYKFSGIDAETVRMNLCKHNPNLKGCENKLSSGAGAPVQGGGCQ
jgi:predicted DsbA family dithiol-disulfide isomerase